MTMRVTGLIKVFLGGAGALALAVGCGDDTSPTVRADGAELLYRPATGSAQNPAFAPDGETIIFTLYESGFDAGAASLWTLNGAMALPLLREPNEHNVNSPGACCDAGTGRLAFSSDREGFREIWTLALEGGGVTRLTHHYSTHHFVDATYSPDGEWVTYVSANTLEEEARRGSIWKVRSDGSEYILLADTLPTGEDSRRPNWSKVGGRIAFQRRYAGPSDWDVYSFTEEGYDVRLHTTDAGNDVEPCWSPDGEYICYASDAADGVYSLYVVAAAGGVPKRVTWAGTRDGSPSWSPDGRWIIFHSRMDDYAGAPAALWRVAAPTQP